MITHPDRPDLVLVSVGSVSSSQDELRTREGKLCADCPKYHEMSKCDTCHAGDYAEQVGAPFNGYEYFWLPLDKAVALRMRSTSWMPVEPEKS